MKDPLRISLTLLRLGLLNSLMLSPPPPLDLVAATLGWPGSSLLSSLMPSPPPQLLRNAPAVAAFLLLVLFLVFITGLLLVPLVLIIVSLLVLAPVPFSLAEDSTTCRESPQVYHSMELHSRILSQCNRTM